MNEDLLIVNIIDKGEKNTRYLVQDSSGTFYSFVFKNNVYAIGDFVKKDKIQIQEAKTNWRENFLKAQNYPRKQMMDHLIKYKEERLKNFDKGCFNDQLYSHIFITPEHNLILNYGYDGALLNAIKKLKQKGELRSDFVNINSSQAFAVNFFTPLIYENKLGLIDECFSDNNNIECDFEVVEDDQEKTQFDFLVTKPNGTNVCSVEVKYSESRFGPAENDVEHENKFSVHYKKRMEVLACVAENDYEFYDYYQIWRNLIYTVRNPGQDICFLFPAFRKDLYKAVEHVKSKCKKEYWTFIHTIIVDDAVNRIIALGGGLGRYYSEFKKKYLDINCTQW